MNVNGKQMAQQLPQNNLSNLGVPAPPPIHEIIVGNGLSQTNYRDGVVSINLLQQPVQRITGGPGIVITDNRMGDVHIDTISPIVPPPQREYSKPIFMIGLPSSTPIDDMHNITDNVTNKLDGYHVLVLRNQTDVYTAKLFSEQDDDTLSFSDVKQYIEQKLRELKNGKI